MPYSRLNFATSNLSDPTRGARQSLGAAAGLLSQYDKEQQFDVTQGDKMLNAALMTQDRKARLALQEKELAARNAARAQARTDKQAAANANMQILSMIGDDTKQVAATDEGKLNLLADMTSTQLDRPIPQADPALQPFAATGTNLERARAEGLAEYGAAQGPDFYKKQGMLDRTIGSKGFKDWATGGQENVLEGMVAAGQEWGGKLSDFLAPTSEAERLGVGVPKAPVQPQELSLGAITQKKLQEYDAQDKKMQDSILKGNAADRKSRKEFYSNDAEIRKEYGLDTTKTVLKSIQEKVDPMIKKVNDMPAGAEKNALAEQVINYHKTLLATDTKRAGKLLDRVAAREDFAYKEGVKANYDKLRAETKQTLKDNAGSVKSAAAHKKDWEALTDDEWFAQSFKEYLKDKKIK